MGKTATIIGSSGLIGSHLTELIRKDNTFSEIRLIVRRQVIRDDENTRTIVVDFSDPGSFRSAIAGSDSVFCAVGTTNKKVHGDKAEYRKVDYDIPVNAARYTAETGCPRFLLVSSVGADSKSKNFYLGLKGEVEDAVKNLNIPELHIFRPSMLLGNRKEFRFGELLGKIFSLPVSFLIPAKYKPVKASDVAKAMLAASRTGQKGSYIYEHKEIMNLIK